MPKPKEPDYSDWCFQPSEMQTRVPATDDFTAIIRGHLFVEYVLINFLREALPRHDFVQLDRIPFNSKVELCAGLNVLPESLIAPIKKINALRNKAAHDLNYKLSLQEKLDLLDSFDDETRNLALEDDEGNQVERQNVQFARMVKLAAILAEIFRHKYKEVKAKRTEALLNARRVLEKVHSPSEG